MARISRHQAYMETARVWAKRSTCFRLNVGAVIVHDRNIVSIGYNGPPSGEEHCTGRNCAPAGGGCVRAVHAELNAIQRLPASVLGQPLSLYVTDSPCAHCFDAITQTSIIAIYYQTLYRINNHITRDRWEGSVWRMTPSGYIIDHFTGELVDFE